MTRPVLALVAVVAALAGALAVWLVDRSPGNALGGADRVRVERVVHDYLQAHPEFVAEATQQLQDRDTAKAITANRAAIETPVGDAWAGNPRGDVTLVEYFDYNCGYCRSSLPTVAQLIAADPKLRVVYQELPVLAETSAPAARASLAAAAQGRFARFHEALYAAGPVSPASITATARATGVDLSHTPADADDLLHRNIALAGQIGMSGTPSWVIGDRILVGAQTLAGLQQAVAAARR